MSTEDQVATGLIRGLKAHFGVESDDALATQIGVAKSTIATWRRRGAVPSKAISELESRFGLTVSEVTEKGKEELRSYLLRQAFYYVLLSVVQQSYMRGTTERDDAIIADDCAVIEPFLKRVVVRAASAPGYEGIRGASSFLLDLRADALKVNDLMREAITERRVTIGAEDLPAPPTNPPTNR